MNYHLHQSLSIWKNQGTGSVIVIHPRSKLTHSSLTELENSASFTGAGLLILKLPSGRANEKGYISASRWFPTENGED